MVSKHSGMHCFRFAKVDGPPQNWELLEIRNKASGAVIDGVIEANADEGWYTRYLKPQDEPYAEALLKEPGDVITKAHDQYSTITLNRDIEITYSLDMLDQVNLDKDDIYLNWQDIAEGVHYDEDLSEIELEWKNAGFPMCKGCGQEPDARDHYCMTCEYRNQQHMHEDVFDDLVEAGKITIVERDGLKIPFYRDRRVNVLDKPTREEHHYVDYHEGGDLEGWGFKREGWYIRSHIGECGACAQCMPQGPYDDCEDAEDAIKEMFKDD